MTTSIDRIVAAGITVKQCPITGGRITRMTEASAVRICRAHQRRAAEGIKNRGTGTIKSAPSWCLTCRGTKWPQELHILSPKEAQAMAAAPTPQKTTKEHAMPTLKTRGTCEGCGHGNILIGRNYGKMMCSTCSQLHATARGRIPAVIEAIKNTGQDGAVLEALGGNPKGHAESNDQLAAIADIVGYQGPMSDENGLVAQVRHLAGILEEYRHGNRPQNSKVAALSGMDALAGNDRVVVQVESAALQRIGALVNYEGTDGDELVEQVQHLADLLEEYRKGTPALQQAFERVTQDNARLAAESTALAEQLREAEQLAGYREQLLIAIRDALGDAPFESLGNLPRVVEQTVEDLRAQLDSKIDEARAVAGVVCGGSSIDSHLLDLLVEFPAIGVERIAVIRESV